MAEKSSFFTSLNGDRKYKSTDFAEYFSTFIGNGIFPNPSTNLEVFANDDMTVTIKKGYAWINGYMYANTEDLILELDYADNSLNRIDRVVVRLDIINREIKLQIKKGEFSLEPTVSELQRNSDIYELCLADIKVNNGTISISQENILDNRLNSKLCGMVNSLIKVDSTILTDKLEQDFYDWFGQVKNVLGEDEAANLLAEINKTNDRIDNLKIKATSVVLDDIDSNFLNDNLEEVLKEISLSQKATNSNFSKYNKSIICTQSEYEGLEPKLEDTLYFILKG